MQLGGTFAIPLAVFYFDRAEERRADNNSREQALEAYLDKMSELLIDKELNVLINKQESSKLPDSKEHKLSDSEIQKLDAVINVACVTNILAAAKVESRWKAKNKRYSISD